MFYFVSTAQHPVRCEVQYFVGWKHISPTAASVLEIINKFSVAFPSQRVNVSELQKNNRTTPCSSLCVKKRREIVSS